MRGGDAAGGRLGEHLPQVAAAARGDDFAPRLAGQQPGEQAGQGPHVLDRLDAREMTGTRVGELAADGRDFAQPGDRRVQPGRPAGASVPRRRAETPLPREPEIDQVRLGTGENHVARLDQPECPPGGVECRCRFEKPVGDGVEFGQQRTRPGLERAGPGRLVEVGAEVGEGARGGRVAGPGQLEAAWRAGRRLPGDGERRGGVTHVPIDEPDDAPGAGRRSQFGRLVQEADDAPGEPGRGSGRGRGCPRRSPGGGQRPRRGRREYEVFVGVGGHGGHSDRGTRTLGLQCKCSSERQAVNRTSLGLSSLSPRPHRSRAAAGAVPDRGPGRCSTPRPGRR